jgi:SAM-dependent methyltransferase
MSDWTAGYVSDVGYTHGFYRELTPSILALVALTRGTHAPDSDTGMTICELGCGQGFSANLIAAANPAIDYHAIDFNPAHMAGARHLAATVGTPNVHFHERAFAELADTPDLPRWFDVISLHGVYSWISPENRRHIVAFIRDRLKPGGLVYVSYNALPGWAAAMPLRRLFVDHAATGNGPMLPRIEQALAFAKRVVDANPLYARVNPGIKERLEKIQAQNRNYLAHEYFNRDWTPFYHADVAAELAEAKLRFLGSAHLLDHIDAVNLTAEQQALLGEVGDPTLRETLRDFIVNQQFRRDVFVRGAVPLSLLESRGRWLDTRFAFWTARADVPLTVAGPLGTANLQPEIYDPLLDALADGPRTLRQLTDVPAIGGLGWPRIVQALQVLVGAGHLQPALPARGDAERGRRTKVFNTVVMERAKASGDLQFLASPVTGGGVAVDRFEQLFLLARQTKQSDPALFIWEGLSALGQRLMKDGKALETAEENIADLRTRLAAFSEKRLPLLQRLGIA